MGIFDKAKELIEEHPEQVDKAIGEAGNLADKRTGGAYTDKIDEAEKLVEERLNRPDPA